MKTLKELRTEWEKGLKPWACFETIEKAVVVILIGFHDRDTRGRWHIHRYFCVTHQDNDFWTVSVDLQKGSETDVMEYILGYFNTPDGVNLDNE